ncbi:MAG: AI-2E family transporter [bacterium]
MKEERTALVFFIVLVVLATGLLLLVMAPFASALFLGTVLAGAFHPLWRWLTLRLGGRSRTAAAFCTVAVTVALVLPSALLVFLAGREVVGGLDYLQETWKRGGIKGIARELPEPIRSPAEDVADEIPGKPKDLQKMAGAGTPKAAEVAGNILSGTVKTIIQVALMLVAFFFLLVDGEKLVQWTADLLPLERSQTFELLSEFRRTSVAVLISTLVTAGVQAGTALAGYLIAAVPKPFFFALITFFMSFIPAIGGGGVVAAVSLFMLLTGHPWAALFLIFWAGVVGISDNIVKPLVVKGSMGVHGGVILFSLLGGLALFGLEGLIAGPLILTFFLTVVRMYRRRVRAIVGPEAPSQV